MNADIQIFNNPQFGSVRTAFSESGEPLFCLADICKAVDLTNPSSVKGRLDPEDTQLVDLRTLNPAEGMLINPMANFVTENGFYDVILQSSSDKVRPFKKWVTHEVLPSIRKHGAYMTQAVLERTIEDPDYFIGLATALKNEREAKQKALREAAEKQKLLDQTRRTLTDTAAKLSEAAPKAEYCDDVLASENLVSVRQIAKDFGKTANWLNRYLAAKGIQFKQGRQWLLYEKYAAMDLARSVTAKGSGNGADRAFLLTKWTQKGRRFITGLLAQDGIFPVPARQQELMQAQISLL